VTTRPPAGVEIRRATVDDAAAAAGIHHRGWLWGYRGLIPDEVLAQLDLPEREARWRELLSDRKREAREWVAVRGGRVVGFVNAGPPLDPFAEPGTGEVYAIYLEEDAAGLGIGRALLDAAVADLWARGFDLATLWVLETNDRARGFYEHMGWTTDGAAKTADLHGFTLHEVRYVLRP
jgi:ribosomal protein S18 acetylase RimI-like enzyme